MQNIKTGRKYSCSKKLIRINLIGNYMRNMCKTQGYTRKMVYLAVGRNGAPHDQCEWDDLMPHDDKQWKSVKNNANGKI